MSDRPRYLLRMITLFLLASPLLSSCDAQRAPAGSHQPSPPVSHRQASPSSTQTAPSRTVHISTCKGRVHGATGTSAPPTSTPRSIYFGESHGDLYAVNAQTGNVRWCMHALPVEVGRPAAVDGVVYVCASSGGETGSLYAFNASDGSLRWRTQTDCWIVDIPFGDYALPLLSNGVVYSGLYAVRAQDGQALWKVQLDLAQEGEFILLAVADGVVYGCTEGGIYAINAMDGSIGWRYPPMLL